jgi:hypothetical protein
MPKNKRAEAKRRRKKRELQRQRAHCPRTETVDARLAHVDIHRETRHIVQRAQAGEGRVVTLGNLVLFSTESRDAWLLDPEDNFALCLARDGEPMSYRIVETSSTFAIMWDATFEIRGQEFIVAERSGRVHSIHGYPAAQIADACSPIDKGVWSMLRKLLKRARSW